VLRYAREGFGVGLRAIADDAGVSAALIVHHFGSKEGLRAECDAHVLAAIRESKERALVSGGTQDLLLQLASMDEYAPLVGYALRSLQAGGDLARAFVEHFAADAEVYIAAAVTAGTMRPSRDEKARARYLTVQGLGTLLLDLTLNPPADPTDVVGMLHAYRDRTMLPAVELFTHGLMTDNTMLDAYLLYVGDPPQDSGAARSA
jgi:AcrR family transcriptional regulator